ncbi:MAG: alpha/beta fold hydrolase [Planctomycetes bacterium]|nr:alpha/beta fold hydrolase [Planctomycetota bacterium]
MPLNLERRIVYSMPEPESITSIELQVPCGSDRAPLGATLTLPAKPRACALILQGSGPHDRDGAMPAFNFRSTLYKRLAHELGTRFGIACLRYDKRGHDLPADAPRDYSLVERLQDAASAFLILESRAEIAALPRFLIGHSEGGMLAARLGWFPGLIGRHESRVVRENGSSRLSGVISLTAPQGNLFFLNHARARLLAGSNVPGVAAKGQAALEYFDSLERMFRAKPRTSPSEFLQFANAYRDKGFAGWESYFWLREHWLGKESYGDPTQTDLPVPDGHLPGGIPMLVVQGGRDARLPDDNPKKWEEWCAARKLASYLLIPDMGHDLNDARRKAFVLDESLLTGIGDWIEKQVQG